MTPIELFPKPTKEHAIMRTVLSMPKGRTFTAKEVVCKMNEHYRRMGATATMVGVFLKKYEGEYTEFVGIDNGGNLWRLI